jgi:hypothetical protein
VGHEKEFALRVLDGNQLVSHVLFLTLFQRQSASGSNFRMCLKVGYHKEDDDVDTTEFAKVIVHRDLNQEHSLTSWVQDNCGDDSETVAQRSHRRTQFK